MHWGQEVPQWVYAFWKCKPVIRTFASHSWLPLLLCQCFNDLFWPPSLHNYLHFAWTRRPPKLYKAPRLPNPMGGDWNYLYIKKPSQWCRNRGDSGEPGPSNIQSEGRNMFAPPPIIINCPNAFEIPVSSEKGNKIQVWPTIYSKFLELPGAPPLWPS